MYDHVAFTLIFLRNQCDLNFTSATGGTQANVTIPEVWFILAKIDPSFLSIDIKVDAVAL